MGELEDKIEGLEYWADRLRSKIKTCYRLDYFHDASKFEYELEMLEKEIEELKIKIYKV